MSRRVQAMRTVREELVQTKEYIHDRFWEDAERASLLDILDQAIGTVDGLILDEKYRLEQQKETQA